MSRDADKSCRFSYSKLLAADYDCMSRDADKSCRFSYSKLLAADYGSMKLEVLDALVIETFCLEITPV